ncbi:MAG: NUDIX domain-containing protein [Firmicutes bacterium]|nr:NUDIX domain-containing protein [Bacillota bacterium]
MIGVYKGTEGVTRDFVATTVIADAGRALLLFHRKLQRWLPPGGHIDAPELPDAAAVREAWEETGLVVELVAEYEPHGFGHALARPAGIQLEDIEPGHQHIDLIYFARPIGSTEPRHNAESERIGWFTPEEMVSMGVDDEVIAWCRKSIRAICGAAQDPLHPYPGSSRI